MFVRGMYERLSGQVSRMRVAVRGNHWRRILREGGQPFVHVSDPRSREAQRWLNGV